MRLIGDYSFFITLNFEPTFDKEYEPENWGKAVNNENFRKAIFHGFDNITYIAARYPGDDPETHKSTAITPTNTAPPINISAAATASQIFIS